MPPHFLWPCSPGIDVDRDDGTGRWLTSILLVLLREVGERSAVFDTSPNDPCGAVDTNPPEGGPVLDVMVYEERGRWVHAEVVKASQRDCRLGLCIDRRVESLATQYEAARNQVRKVSGSDGGQMPDSGLLYPAAHRWTVHFQTLDPGREVSCLKGLDASLSRRAMGLVGDEIVRRVNVVVDADRSQ